MAYGRESIMRGLRKAGEGIRRVDDAYTQKIYDSVDNYAYDIADKRAINPVEQALIGAALGGSNQITYLGNHPNKVMQYAEPIAGTAKYLIPAAGVTAAGAGLYDLAQQFSADQEYNNVQPL